MGTFAQWRDIVRQRKVRWTRVLRNVYSHAFRRDSFPADIGRERRGRVTGGPGQFARASPLVRLHQPAGQWHVDDGDGFPRRIRVQRNASKRAGSHHLISVEEDLCARRIEVRARPDDRVRGEKPWFILGCNEWWRRGLPDNLRTRDERNNDEQHDAAELPSSHAHNNPPYA